MLVILSLLVGLIIELYITNNTLSPGIMIWINVPIFALTFIIGMYWSKKPLGYFIHQKFIPLATWIIIIFTTFGLVIVMGEISNLIIYYFPIPDYIYTLFENVLSSGWGLTAAILVAAITEEFLFRGMILSGLSKNYSFWPAIFLSSLLFGVIHLIPWQIFPAFVAGIFLGWVYLKFKSIWLCMGIHGINNAVSAIPEYLDITIPGLVYDVREGVQFQPIWLDMIGMILLIFGIFTLNKLSSDRYNKSTVV